MDLAGISDRGAVTGSRGQVVTDVPVGDKRLPRVEKKKDQIETLLDIERFVTSEAIA